MRQHTSDGYWTAMLRGGLAKVFLLQALREGPGHGYALAGRVELMTQGFCSPSQASVYPSLRELESDGCVEHRVEATGRRRRKVYTLTPRGRQALRAAVSAWEDGLAVIRRVVSRT